MTKIKNYLGGNIGYRKSQDTYYYGSTSFGAARNVINYFNKFNLQSRKHVNYLKWRKVYTLIQDKQHLTDKGLLEILSLKGSLNLGLSENIKNVFPNIKIKEKPKYEFNGIPSPFWLSGFISGDGSFHIVFRSTAVNAPVFLRFSVHLHIRDLEVLKGINTYLKEKDISNKKITLTKNSANLQITKYSDIVNVIIPFFNNYPILGMKSLDFEDFKKVSNII